MTTVDLQVATGGDDIPEPSHFTHWTQAALRAAKVDEEKEISIRIVDENESQQLNHQYRNKNTPTNVLSFSCELPEEVNLPLLGDLVICSDVVKQEAQEQNKPLESHWAHMVVHGTLHLLGYDHIDPAEADTMENLETHILTTLGYPAPYDNP